MTIVTSVPPVPFVAVVVALLFAGFGSFVADDAVAVFVIAVPL